MNSSLQPLMALLAQTERERDNAAADVERAARAQRAAADQAQQLLDYRGDYERRWGAQFRIQGQMELVNVYRNFMEKLSSAVDQQQRAAVMAESHVERLRAALLQHEVRVASVRKLIERRMAEMRLSADRADQKQTDEFAARSAWSRQVAIAAAMNAAR